MAKKTIIAERNGKDITLLTNDTLSENSFEKKMIQSYATGNFCKLQRFDSIRNCHFFKNNKILIVDKISIFNTSLKPDIIVMRSSPKVNLERLLLNMKPKMIVADASNYKSYVSAWKASCAKENPFS